MEPIYPLPPALATRDATLPCRRDAARPIHRDAARPIHRDAFRPSARDAPLPATVTRSQLSGLGRTAARARRNGW